MYMYINIHVHLYNAALRPNYIILYSRQFFLTCFISLFQHELQEELLSKTPPEMIMSHNIFVASTAQSGIKFYISQSTVFYTS